jgi:gliding motility-associated-like protein
VYVRLSSTAVNGASGNITFTVPGISAAIASTGTATVFNFPTTANAGADQVNCNNGNFTMAANLPSAGSASWTLVSGTATITNAGSYLTTVTGIPAGTTATFRWTISNGLCPANSDDVVLTNTALPTPANAGVDQVNCNNGSFTMAANLPSEGSASWTLVSGTATITNAGSYLTTVTGIPAGTSATLRWTISNGICPVSTDDVVLTNTALGTTPNAGPDQVNCNNGNFTMAANLPSVGSASWSLVSGTATITSAGSYLTTVTGVPAGTSATIRWTISNGICQANSDDVVITNTALPTPANAGADQVNCNNGNFTMAANLPSVGSASWTLVSGTATITNAGSYLTTVTGIPAGTSATLRWTITNGICPVSTDDVVLTNTALPTPANAGADQVNCNNGNFTMAANLPSVGSASWSLVSGTATITNAGSYTTTVTGVPAGTSATLRWTINNGICPVSTDDVVLTNTALPTTANAGADLVNCNNGSFTMAGNIPTVGTGAWSVVSGTATIANAGSATTSITGVPAGTTATLRWTISNGICPVSTDDVVLTNTALPTPAEAGADQVNCNNGTFTMAANLPSVGSASWSLVSGTATITSAGSRTTTITDIPAGTSATLRWTISNGICPVSTDDVVLTNTALPTPANAGSDLVNCNNGTFTMAGNIPTVGTGAWSLVSGMGIITTTSDAKTTVTGVPAGTSAVLRWTITNGICPVSTDDLTVTNTALPTPANAGIDLINCNNGTFTMTGNNPTVGTGTWTLVSGTATITTPASATTTVTGVPAGTSPVLRWTITNGICPASTDEMTITNQPLPTTAQAGPDQALCNTSIFTMAANTPTIGSGRWILVSGTAMIVDDRSPVTSVSGIAAGASVTLRWSITNGICAASTDDVVLTNKALATVTTTTGAENCGPAALTLRATASTGGTIRWFDAATGGNLQATGNTLITTVLSTTTTFYAEAILDGCPSLVRVPVTATIKLLPPTPTVTAQGPTTFCEGSSVTLISSSTTGNQWYNKGVLIPGAVNQTYIVTQSGNYHVVVTNAQGCTSLPGSALAVVVNPIPAMPASITGLTSVSEGSNQTYTATPVPGATAYIWTLPSGWTGTSTTNTITTVPGATGGRITVRATANGCTSPAAFLDVTVVDDGEILKVFKSASSPELQPDGTYLIRFAITLKNMRNQPLTNVMVTDDLTRTFPNPITFQVTQVRASGSLSVDPLYNGRSLVELLTPVSTLRAFGTDSINLTVKIEPNGYAGNVQNIADVNAATPLGKVNVQSIDMSRSGGRETGPGVPTLTVIKPVQLIIPTIFTPNNDGFNDKWVIVRPSGVKIKVQVYNRWGQMVYRSDDYRNDWDGKGTGSFLGKDLPHGSYFFLVDIDDTRTGTKEVRRGALMLKRDTY